MIICIPEDIASSGIGSKPCSVAEQLTIVIGIDNKKHLCFVLDFSWAVFISAQNAFCVAMFFG